MNKHIVSIYSKNDSKIKKIIESNIDKFKKIEFDFHDISDHLPPEKVVGSLILFEETAYENIQEKFAEIIDSYNYKPAFIVFSEKPTFESAVSWVKQGADNYVDISKKLNINKIQNIFYQSLFFDGNLINNNHNDKTPFDFPCFSLEKDHKWDSLSSGEKYKMTMVLVNIVLGEKTNRIHKNHLDKMLLKINEKLVKTVVSLGGKELIATPESELFVFYFGERKNIGVSAAISLLNRVQILSFEDLQLSEKIDISISIHDGEIVYNDKDTRFITSDALNSVSHLRKMDNHLNTINITENIYESLNPRLKRFFIKKALFEGRLIYTYYYKPGEIE